jgi:superfamily II DNA or RNA helicase
VCDANDSWLAATVQGSRRYDVDLELDRNRVIASCSCPVAETGEPCKHVWATLVVGEAEGALPWLGEARTLVLGEIGDDDELHADEIDEPSPVPPPVALVATPRREPAPPRQGAASWRTLLSAAPQVAPAWSAGPDLRYVVQVAVTRTRGRLTVDLYRPNAGKRQPGWHPAEIHRPVASYVRPADALLIGMLEACDATGSSYGPLSRFDVPAEAARELVERLCASGRLHLGDPEAPALRWDPAPYSIALELRGAPGTARYQVEATLVRDGERVDASEPALVVSGALVLWSDRAAPLAGGAGDAWVIQQRVGRHVVVPAREMDDFIEAAHASSAALPLKLPPELSLPEETIEGRPYVRFVSRRAERYEPAGVGAEAGLDYAGLRARLDRPGRALPDRQRRRIVLRDAALEASRLEQLAAVGVRPERVSAYGYARRSKTLAYRVAAGRLESAARELVATGWRVEVDGKLRRTASDFGVAVTTGIDWLDVRLDARFEGVEAPLPELLAALRARRSTVTLADGSIGQIPDAWIDRLRRWSALAQGHPDGQQDAASLRFAPVQAALIAALLEREERASVDPPFAKLRETLRSFDGVRSLDAPTSFQGSLRDYQRYAQGWFAALRQLGFGACLADDMGLGKTVQVLAMIERRRKERPAPGPSLVVAPRSVVTNWAQEAARFVPRMRVLLHSGAERLAPGDHLRDHDLVLCTYGVLRKDALALSRVAFDYVILDEAQAIKTAGSESAKAARVLKARHRLALTGTPVENHLGELGSLLDFLNPGILGVGGLSALGARGNRRVDDETLAVVARSVRPFLLRRTKAQVAPELPDRIEQTLDCELQGEQKRLYDELHAHYRRSIDKRVRTHGVARSTVYILEALLRLRQAACHPGLIDDKRRGEPSAKLEALIERLEALREQGQKALVFSQFTSLLSIVRERLDERGIVHEYLDGQTRDRAERVARFQSDQGCGVFLISLKAGGLGLNLTAAPVVEPRGRGAGDRPGAPHRTDAPRHRVPAARPRHGRGQGRRAAEAEARAGRGAAGRHGRVPRRPHARRSGDASRVRRWCSESADQVVAGSGRCSLLASSRRPSPHVRRAAPARATARTRSAAPSVASSSWRRRSRRSGCWSQEGPTRSRARSSRTSGPPRAFAARCSRTETLRAPPWSPSPSTRGETRFRPTRTPSRA